MFKHVQKEPIKQWFILKENCCSAKEMKQIKPFKGRCILEGTEQGQLAPSHASRGAEG